MKTLKAILVISLAILCETAFAGNITVKGTVVDSRGEAIIGAVVMEDGTSNGVTTDINGKYSITLNATAKTKLVYSSIGFLSFTAELEGRTSIDVILQDDMEQLEEVVVVGYGAIRKSDITGSVTSVKIDETIASQNASLDQLLQGHAAGVQVLSNSAAPDASVSVKIRGASSFNSNSQPLYVVDGVIINTDGSATVGSHEGSTAGIDEDTNGLIGINPQDIASMEVLKDASATAIYGSQGANGVILITTKNAQKDKPSITFTAGISLSNIYKKFELMDSEDYKQFLDMKGVAHTSELYSIYTKGVENGTYSPIDWQDYSTRLSVTQRYFFTIDGRPKGTNYRFSMSYFDNDGVIKGTGYENFTFRLNLDKTIGKFNFGTKTAFSYLHSEMTQGAGSTISQSPESSMVLSMLLTRPLIYNKSYDEEGFEIDTDDNPPSGPDKWLTEYQSERKEIRVTPSIFLNYKILPWLSFKSTFGADYRTNERLKFKSSRINTQATGSTGAVTHQERFGWNWDNLLTFNTKIKKHSINATLGQSASQTISKSEGVEGTNVAQWKAMAASLNTAPYNWYTYGESSSQLLSFFGRIVYNYGNRYILTGTYRFDGSSKFIGDNKWAQFPSLAFAWRAHKEKWFKVPCISNLKFRLGWGKVGNQGIPTYQTSYRYSSNTTATHDNDSHKQTTISSYNFPSRDLRWETTTQYNAGLDIAFFNGRLSLETDVYYKYTDDLLQVKTLPASSGVLDPWVNMGAISNKGFEITLSAVPISTKTVEWTIGGNFSLNRNRIESIDPTGSSTAKMYLYQGQPIQDVEYFTGDLLSQDSICHDYINIFVAGQPMGLFYAMPTNGIVQEGQMGVPFADGKFRGAGSVNFVDTNNDGVITADDRVVVGDPNPDFTYGFNTSLKIKNLTISAFFVGSYGNDIYNQQAAILTDMTTNSANRLRAAVFDSWSPSNKNAKYPSISAYTANDVNWCTDRFVEDGSYLRMSNATVNYNFRIKNKKSPLRNINVGISGKNLFVITNYSGYDPDVNVYGSTKKYGVDNGAYPSARTYMLDLKLNF